MPPFAGGPPLPPVCLNRSWKFACSAPSGRSRLTLVTSPFGPAPNKVSIGIQFDPASKYSKTKSSPASTSSLKASRPCLSQAVSVAPVAAERSITGPVIVTTVPRVKAEQEPELDVCVPVPARFVSETVQVGESVPHPAPSSKSSCKRISPGAANAVPTPNVNAARLASR